VPGLGTSFGRGGATTFAMDMKHADAVMIMGSNMAECHPVAFRWVMQAKTRPKDAYHDSRAGRDVVVHPAKIIHVDPRFTRTSAMADTYAPLRAGSDIAFLGGLIKYVLDEHEKIFVKKAQGKQLTDREQFFHDYLVHYTNAATLITDEFKDTEDNRDDDGIVTGLFAGFQPDKKDQTRGRYDVTKWRYSTEPAKKPSIQPEKGESKGQSWSAQVGKLVGKRPDQDPSLRAGSRGDDKYPCVWQILRKHYRRYTPKMVEEVCGTPQETFHQVAETLLRCSGPHHTSAICYAVGWTQHTVGVQIIRAAGVLQLLLGNIGRPGGGILALRGHATIQGSTDIATLYNIHPGYLNTPSAHRPHDTLRDYILSETSPTSYWANFPKFIISQLIAWYGDDAVKDLATAYNYLPKIIGDHSHLPMFVDMHAGVIKGFFALGQNPAVGGQNASFQRQALAKLDWLVVRDLYETETASFWKDSPEVQSGKLKPEDIPTEVFFLPAAAVAENDGSFTNTQRLVQWHDKAVDPPEDARSDLWFTYHLGLRLKELYKDSTKERDRPIQALRWDYLDRVANAKWHLKDEPSANLVLKEINGYVWEKGKSLKESKPLSSFAELTDDGKPVWTACGAWIYTGVFASGKNHAAGRQGDAWVALGWGFSWPANRRLMYNRASADPAGDPWPKEAHLAGRYARGPGAAKGYVYWDGEKWTGLDVPDFGVKKPPTDKGNSEKLGLDYLDGVSPFIMKADGKGWLFVPNGLVDGPLPTHYEPYESPVANAMYQQQSNPAAMVWNIPGNPYAKAASREFPHVLSTYRLTEHHLSGTMSRWLPWLAELQPELFCELSTEHAEELGVQSTDWVKITTPRGSVRAKALVTRRIRPYQLKDRKVHHVGLPWHWGYKGLVRGDVVNDLSALVGDPNVTIHEAKVFVCQVEKLQ
jgi:formate dehydrogenase major subunit